MENLYNGQMDWISRSEEDTIAHAQNFAPDLSAGDVICLYGDLGMGKSVFARGLIRALTATPQQEVPSPTFTLVQTYDSAQGEIWHFDLYRLQNPDEVYELGWEEALGSAISIIEWPTRLGDLLPPDRIDIHFTLLADGGRLLQVERRGAKKV